MTNRILLAFAAFLTVTGIYSQDFQGVATYEEKTLIEGFNRIYTLSFDKTSSLYKTEKTYGKAGQTFTSTGGSMDGSKYIDLKQKKYTQEINFFDKEFLVSDPLEAMEWKTTNETKMIGQYKCFKATRVIKMNYGSEEDMKKSNFSRSMLDELPKEIIVTAWYTPEIPVSHGPDLNWGLPGLILEIIKQGESTTCSKIVLNPKDKVVIKAPVKGKKVTYAEFEKIAGAKLEEMRAQSNGGILIQGVGN